MFVNARNLSDVYIQVAYKMHQHISYEARAPSSALPMPDGHLSRGAAQQSKSSVSIKRIAKRVSRSGARVRHNKITLCTLLFVINAPRAAYRALNYTGKHEKIY